MTNRKVLDLLLVRHGDDVGCTSCADGRRERSLTNDLPSQSHRQETPPPDERGRPPPSAARSSRPGCGEDCPPSTKLFASGPTAVRSCSSFTTSPTGVRAIVLGRRKDSLVE
jgi:hypothetical protein